jgi:RNA polymerase sigma-70 factor, ECF subfamily
LNTYSLYNQKSAKVHKKKHTRINDDELSLVERAVKKDAEAFGELYDAHIDRVYKHVYYRVSNKTDAEDLTQQVFLKAWQSIDRYRKTESPFAAWLMTISHNMIVDFYRTRKDGECLDGDTTDHDPRSEPEKAAEADFEQERIRRAIFELKSVQQQVVVFRLVEGFQFKEIASALGKNEGTVRVIFHRALARLQRILEKEKDDGKKD